MSSTLLGTGAGRGPMTTFPPSLVTPYEVVCLGILPGSTGDGGVLPGWSPGERRCYANVEGRPAGFMITARLFHAVP